MSLLIDTKSGSQCRRFITLAVSRKSRWKPSATPPEKLCWRSMPAKITFLAPILAEGSPAHPSDNQLVNASKLNLGEQYTDEKITAGIEGMQRTLQENGYYQATIKPYYEWDSRNQQVKVQFMVDRGKPARIGVINVGGSPGYSAEEVRKITKLRSGDKVTAAHRTRALQRLRKRFQKQDRLEAQVTMTQRLYHPETNLLDYTFEINRGPVVDVKVEGAKLRARAGEEICSGV